MLRYIGLALLLPIAVAAAGETTPRARLVGKAPTLVAGRPWTATVRVTSSAGTPRLVARSRARVVRFPLRRVRRGAYSAVVRLPAGAWKLFVATGAKLLPLGSVRVLPANLTLEEPGQIAALPDGSLLVAERGARDRIVRVDPATGAVRTFAAGLSDPFGLAVAPDGSVLVSAAGAVHRVPAAGGRPVELARLDAGPLAPAANGDLYYANRGEVGVLRAGSSSPDVFPVQVEIPHGLILGGGSLFVSDSGNGRILRVDLAARRATTVAANLATPLALAAAGDDLITAEYSAGTLLRVSPAGGVATVARGLNRPYAATVTRDAIYVVEAGGTLVRVLPDGTLRRLRLRRP
jgi:streptogramin lyase